MSCWRSCGGVLAVEEALELAEELEARLAHDVEHAVGSMLGSHFEASAHMARYQFAVILFVVQVDGGIAGAVHREVVADAGAYE